MKRVRALGRMAGALARVVTLVPALALIPASVLDRGPTGAPRLTLFPPALTILDPHLWECSRNSLLMAVVVTITARLIGVNLASIVTRSRFWGRPLLATLAVAGLAAPPAFVSLGLLALFGSDHMFLTEPYRPITCWLWWFWSALASSVPIVALVAASGLSRVDPVGEDAARLEGAGRRKIWRRFLWPSVRPGVARALALVFSITLIEPGAPLVLGLRRTLGFQIVEAATDPAIGQFNRAAVLALGATLIAGLARVLIGWWGGTESPRFSKVEPGEMIRVEQHGFLLGFLHAATLFLASVLVWLPLLGLISALVPMTMEPGQSWLGAALATFARLFTDPLSSRALRNSVLMALGVLVVGAALAAGVLAGTTRRSGRIASGLARLSGTPGLLPPLAIGVGILALSDVLLNLADLLEATPSGIVVARLIRVFSDVLNVNMTPEFGMVLAVSLTALPLLRRSALERRGGVVPSHFDAAMGLGASPRLARQGLRRTWLGVAPSAAFLCVTTAFSNVTPSLLFATTSATRTAGPAVLTLVDEPGAGLSQAAALATLSVGLNLFALSIAARKHSGVSRVWLGT